MTQKTIDDVYHLVELAGIYIEDGAPRTAAERLRSAAGILDALANARSEVPSDLDAVGQSDVGQL